MGVNAQSTKWSYTLPENPAGKYTYQITYQTIADNSKIVGVTPSKNKVTVKDDKWEDFGEAEVDIIPSLKNKLSVRKSHEEGDITDVDATWTITVNIPENGLNHALQIYDTLPDDGTVKDRFKEIKSVTLITGEGEDAVEESIPYFNSATGKYHYRLDPEATNGKQAWICFGESYSESKYESTPAIRSIFQKSEDQRSLVIRLTTTPDGENASWPKGHTRENNVYVVDDNNARAWDNDIYRYPNPEITKAFKEKGSITIKGEDVPVCTYYIRLQDVNSNTVEISDVIEKVGEYFEVLENDEIGSDDAIRKMRVGAGEIGKSGFDSSLEEWNPEKHNAGSVEWVKESHTFTLRNLAKKRDGSFYPEYCLVYSVKLINETALLQQALKKENYTISVCNTAKWKERSLTSSARVDFKTEPLKKEITIPPETKNNYIASFQLTVNPDGLDLVSEPDMLLIEDQLENMRLDIGTVRVQYGDGKPVPVNVDYDESTGIFRLCVDDGEPVLITYDARVLAGDNESVTIVTIQNPLIENKIGAS